MSVYSIYTLYLFSYLLGSIPFGLIFVKVTGGGDIREQGSGNIGATNVLRGGHKKLAAATLLADSLKGAFPVLMAYIMEFSPVVLCLTAGAAILGHVFPLWLSFKGGKGVATAFGTYLVLDPLVGLLCLATWGIVAKVGKISSVSALVAFFMAPIYEIVLRHSMPEFVYPVALFMMGVYVLIVWTHRENIRRILKGEESIFRSTNKD